MTHWVTNEEMAGVLRVSTRTLYKFRTKKDCLLFKEGRHWRRSTPSPTSSVLWDRELTEKAWLAELHLSMPVAVTATEAS